MTAEVSNVERATISPDRARELLTRAGAAILDLRESIAELVTTVAWEVLGYANFPEMWEAENGFACPAYAKVLVVEHMSLTRNTRRGRGMTADGYTLVDIANAAGYAVHTRGNGKHTAPTLSGIRRQLDAGVPADKVVSSGRRLQVEKRIEEHGTRARAHPRRIGASPEDLVNVSAYIRKKDDDVMSKIALDNDVPKSEIYRQAVAEYLARYRESRP